MTGRIPHVNWPIDRPRPHIEATDERTMLLGMLDWCRAGVLTRVRGLDDAVARRSTLGTGTTIVGLVKHLALVEDLWFNSRFAGRPEPGIWATASADPDPDWEVHSALEDDVDDVVALYERACARSRSVCEQAVLDELSHRDEPLFTLRYALVHVIEETARHLGHIDILSEVGRPEWSRPDR